MEVMVASTNWKARDEDPSSNRRGTNSTQDELQEHNSVGPMCNHTHIHAGKPTPEDLDYDVLRVLTSRKQRGWLKATTANDKTDHCPQISRYSLEIRRDPYICFGRWSLRYVGIYDAWEVLSGFIGQRVILPAAFMFFTFVRTSSESSISITYENMFSPIQHYLQLFV